MKPKLDKETAARIRALYRLKDKTAALAEGQDK